jgi:hypothetical protein
MGQSSTPWRGWSRKTKRNEIYNEDMQKGKRYKDCRPIREQCKDKRKLCAIVRGKQDKKHRNNYALEVKKSTA